MPVIDEGGIASLVPIRVIATQLVVPTTIAIITGTSVPILVVISVLGLVLTNVLATTATGSGRRLSRVPASPAFAN